MFCAPKLRCEQVRCCGKCALAFAAGMVTALVLSDVYKRQAYHPEMGDKSVIQMLTTALFNANLAVYEESRKSAELKGMGTTAVLALVQRQHLFVVHVGDSRALLLRSGTVRQLKMCIRDSSHPVETRESDGVQ